MDRRDAGPTDAGPTDAGPTDAGPTDAGPTDAQSSILDPQSSDYSVHPLRYSRLM
jgi:hypothetical protein